MIELAVLLAISLAINIFLAWYTRSTLSNLLYLSENLGSLHDLVFGFGAHLKTVYELERFYGDPTSTSLLEHSNAVREELESYADIMMLSEQIDGEEENEEEENDEEVEGGGEEEA